MPSMEDSRRHVEENLSKQPTDVDHDAIIESLQDEIDRHNALRDQLRSTMRNSKSSSKTNRPESSSKSIRFRFKSGVDEPKKRRKHHSARDDSESHHRKRRREDYPTPPEEADDGDAVHPLPRVERDSLQLDTNPEAAFRDSLFDALADDEGAAYWESVYSQPIHVFARPSVQTRSGGLEEMDDEEYAAYVKAQMWERKHPEIARERERSRRQKKEEEEERTRRREDFVRRKEQAAWERAQRRRRKAESDEDDRNDHVFTGEANMRSASPSKEGQYASAWQQYLVAWDNLKHQLLAERAGPATISKPPAEPNKRIPWPVLQGKAAIKANIEDFMRHVPSNDARSKVQILKAERVRWHPDKIQQRFGGTVDEGTMKLVTGVFQVVDDILEKERTRAG